MRAGHLERHPCLQLHITKKCMNRCVFCYHQQNRNQFQNEGQKELDVKQLKHIIDSFCRAAIENKKEPTVELIGGDPFLHKNIFEIIEHARLSGAMVGLRGNPQLLNEAMIEALVKSGIKRVNMSLDGMAEYHDRIRGHQGLFEMTIDRIRALNSHQIVPMIRYTLSAWNKDDLLDLQEYFYKNNVPCVLTTSRCIDRLEPDNMIAYDDLLDVYRTLILRYKKHYELMPTLSYRLIFKDHVMFPLLHQLKILSDEFVEDLVSQGERGLCTMMDNLFIIDCDGAVKLCQKMPQSVLGDCGDVDFSLLFKHQSNRYPYSACVSERCSSCYYQTVCYGCPAYEEAKKVNQCFFYKQEAHDRHHEPSLGRRIDCDTI